MDNSKSFREESPTYQIGITALLSKKAFQNYLKNANIALTPEQVGVLNLLLEEDKLTMQELSNRNNRDNSATTRLIDNIEKKKFVVRKSSPTDRRKWLIILTREGKEEVLNANVVGKDYVQKVLKNIETDEMEVFMNVIKKIKKNIIEINTAHNKYIAHS